MKAIDIHGHFGVYKSKGNPLKNKLLSADIELVRSRARKSGVSMTVVSAMKSLFGNVLAGNKESLMVSERHRDIMFWAVINPNISESFSQAKEMLLHPKCAGVKIHPLQHRYKIRDKGDEIFKFAMSNRAIIMSHSGDSGCFPEDFLAFADGYPEVDVILAHLGNSPDANLARQVLTVKSAKNNNIYVDTSSINSALSGLIEWAVSEIGDNRILFGSDTPLYFVASQKARIENAEISYKAKKKILLENAKRLLMEKINCETYS